MTLNGLPKNWEVKKLGDITKNVEYGSAAKSKLEGRIPVLRMGNIQNGKFDWTDLVYTDDDAEIEKYLLKKNDVLFNRTNNPELVGKTAIYKGERPAIFAGYLIRINRIKSLIDADYLTYFLNSLYARNYGNSVKSFGVNQSNINGTKLKTYPIPLPPLSEQQRIVAKIEELFSELDAGVESLKTAQAQLKTYRQAVLKWAFEGKLTNENLPDGELPSGWMWVKLGELMESVRNGYSKKPDDKGVFPILRISSVRPFKIDLGDVRFLERPLNEANSINENDLLFTRYNGSRDFVGVCARVPALKETIFYPDKLIRCRPIIKSLAHSTYLQYAANTGLAREFVLSHIKTTAGQTGISGEEVKSIPIPICSLEEQQHIVQEIESRLSVCDKLEETIATSLRQAEALRQSILKKAVEGKLVAQDNGEEAIEPAESVTAHSEDEQQKTLRQMKLFI